MKRSPLVSIATLFWPVLPISLTARADTIENLVFAGTATCRTGFARLLIGMLVIFFVVPASADIIHEYTFNGGVTDVAGSANGTLFGGATASAGILSLNGSTGYVQFATDLIPVGGTFTLALNAQQLSPTPGAYMELVSQAFSGAGFYLGDDPSGHIRISDAHLATTVLFPTDMAWHTYLLSYDGGSTQLRLYIDGALVFSGSSLANNSGGTDTRFGRQFDPFAEFFHGNMSDVRIYDTVQTPQNINNTPEPTSLLLLGSGLIALPGVWRRVGNRKV